MFKGNFEVGDDVQKIKGSIGKALIGAINLSVFRELTGVSRIDDAFDLYYGGVYETRLPHPKLNEFLAECVG